MNATIATVKRASSTFAPRGKGASTCMRCGAPLYGASAYRVDVRRDGLKGRYLCRACAAASGEVDGDACRGKAARGRGSRHGLSFKVSVNFAARPSVSLVGELARARWAVDTRGASSPVYTSLCFVKSIRTLDLLDVRGASVTCEVWGATWDVVALDALAGHQSIIFEGLPVIVNATSLIFGGTWDSCEQVDALLNVARDVCKVIEVNFLEHVDINGRIAHKYVERTRVRILKKIASYK